MLEENRDSKKRKTFRIIRENMLIRNEAFPRETVIEFGSGDGSNLLFLAKKYPKTKFIGLKLSQS